MKHISNCYNLFKSFDYYVSLGNNKIIIIINYRFFIFKMPSIFFYKINVDSKSLKLLFLKKKFYIGFIRHLFNFYNKLFVFYYFNLKLKGLGFRIMNIAKNLIKIFFNRNNYFYVHIPSCILLKNRA